MKQDHESADFRQSDGFAQQAQQGRSGIVREFWDFLRYNKKWWLTPIILVLMLVGAFLFLSTSAAVPIIYPL